MLNAWLAGRAYPKAMQKNTSDLSYFLRRAREEEAAARLAHDPRARRSHSDLAEHYARAAESGGLGLQNDEPEPSAIPLLQPEFRILR